MGKILFWNTAGAGTGDQGEELSPTLARLTSQTMPAPDCVVVCEMRKSTRETKQQFQFGDYVYVKPTRPQITATNDLDYYHSKDDKRLYVYSRNPGVIARLITTGRSRPVVHLTLLTKKILVVHLPSVTNSSTPQADELVKAYDIAAGWGYTPDAIFGDFNVDLQDFTRRRRLRDHLAHHALADWKIERTHSPTHKGKSELDWALCAPGFGAHVTAIDPSQQGRPKWSAKFDDMDWNGGDSDANKNSDHLAMVLSW